MDLWNSTQLQGDYVYLSSAKFMVYIYMTAMTIPPSITVEMLREVETETDSRGGI